MALDMTVLYALALPLLLILCFGLLLLFSALAARPKAGTTEWIHRAAFPSPFDPAEAARSKGSDWLLALVAFAAGALLQLIPLYLTTPLSAIGLSKLAPCITIGLAAACSWFAGCQFTGNRLCALLAAILGFCLFSLSGSQDFCSLLALFFVLAALSRIWLLPLSGLLMGLATVWNTSAPGLLLPALVLALLLTIAHRRFLPLLVWLLTAFLTFAVSLGLDFLHTGTIACPLPSLTVPAAPVFFALLLLSILWSAIRIRQESRFTDILLLSIGLAGLAVSFLGCNLLFFLPAPALAEAGRLIRERGSSAAKGLLYAVPALFLAATVGFILNGLGILPSALSILWKYIV